MPVRNEELYIARTLDALVAQNFPPDEYEIIVVDGMSSDATRAIIANYAKRFPLIRVLENPDRWSSAGRNIGIEASDSEIVVVVDGHCELTDPNYLVNVASAFERTGADCLGRPQPMRVQSATAIQRAIALARNSWLGHHPDSHIFDAGAGYVPARSVAVAYRRSIFRELGAFDETFDACEDLEFNHRVDQAGKTCYLTDSIALAYVPRRTFRALFRQLVRYGRGRVRLMRKHPGSTDWKSLTPALLLGFLAIGAVASLLSRPIAEVYLSISAIYLSIVAIASIFLAVRARQTLLAPLVGTALLTLHSGAGFGIIAETAIGRRSKPTTRNSDS